MEKPDQAPPGTVILIDFEGTLEAQHSRNSTDVVLNPVPSSDPNDPLNWSLARKWRATLCALFYTWSVCVSSSACYSVFVPIHEESGVSISKLNEGTGYMYLLFGWALLFWIPLALAYGRRGVYLMSLLGTAMMNIWAGYATTNPTWIATRILIGFFGAPCEALAGVTMADIWFTHERGTYMGLFTLAMFGGTLGPVPAGFITDAMGWPWVLFWCAILNAVAFVTCFFAMEETMYFRQVNDAETDGSSQKFRKEAATETVPDAMSSNEKHKMGIGAQDAADTNISTSYAVKSYFRKLAPIAGRGGRPAHVLQKVVCSIQMLRFPPVVFAGFIYGCYMCWYAVVNATLSLFFGSSPYNFAPSIVGLTYIAEIIGSYLAGFCAGKLADKLSILLTRRNGGIMEPEFRLWCFVGGCIVTPLGLLLFGVGYAHELSWVALVFGMGMVGFVSPAAGSLAVSYVVDCYHELRGEALITVVIIRNTINFGFNYGVTPWLENNGAQDMYVTVAVLAFATTASFLIMIKWGRRMRVRSGEAYWKYARQHT
ncbi:hypothetical protein ASPVEDRAFT_879616 [Aspergillus versicolor CBS 583.65]|uniref:Major facilitator superfamily (MFS) profile domain-containing protein n=1 Tax=Aspergillus versicolor CBS 583.65 TaxID=1036611 RepID=A0A1L9Q4R1_ASPVE|nr:uncharacterized protein ASPVEDRAFT_879616 [Aspergillus versicolor CBS 583.65]OJJ08760.1 hypothetical protein ASPVEDRAFT_879616 [Aspergillus versicolor CBS 583.65]